MGAAHPCSVAVDPSVRSPGACVSVGGQIVACARIKIPRHVAELPTGMRVRAVAAAIVAWVREASGGAFVERLAYEWPQVYTAAKSKGDPNDLIALAAVGAAVAELLDPVEVRTPTPAQWVGQTPKSTTGSAWASARGLRVARRVSPAELAAIPDQHDAIDSAGLCLWLEGRFDPHIVVPR